MSKELIMRLREYAENNGYLHGDYADSLKQAAHEIESLEAERDALRLVCAEAYQMAGALGASVEAPQIDREKVRDAIAEALGCMIYCCTRAWEAWSVGTMRQEDFILASEDDGILDELTAAAISAIEAKPESGSAS